MMKITLPGILLFILLLTTQIIAIICVAEDDPPTKSESAMKGANILEGNIIVASRTEAAWRYGHTAIAFENPDGTWTAGAIEGFDDKLFIKRGDLNGAWVRIFDTRDDVIKEFSSTTPSEDPTLYPGHQSYDEIKVINVKNPDHIKANEAIQGFYHSGYSIPFNDCLTGTHNVLKAYGVKNLPSALFSQNYIPNVYFAGLPGTKFLLNRDNPNPAIGGLGSNRDIGGINFTSIELNYISISTDSLGHVNFDSALIAHRGNGTKPKIDAVNSTMISTTAFMTGLALPGYRFWVNLNPWEPKRLLDDRLGETDVGRIMLEADLQMKKDFSNYENPCANKTGEEFWALLAEKQKSLVRECMEKYPGELRNERNVSFMAVTRFWIVPKTAYAYYNGTSISIINSSLTIRSDPIAEYATYILDNPSISLSNDCREELNKSAIEYSRCARELEESMILPYVVYDVNHAERYSDLRSVYTSLALAQGYKEKIDPKTDALRDSIDSLNVSALKSMTLWSPEEIWERYAYSFSNKEYKCWQNKTINTTFITQNNELIPGTFIESQLIASGGVDFSNLKDNLTFINGIPQDVQTRVDKAISEGYVEEGKDVLFGAKIPVDMINDAIGSSSSPGSGPRPPSNLTSYDSMEVNGHGGDNSTKDQGAYYVCGPCPDGWSGPDENCLCSKWVEVTS